jgi:phosphoglycerate kinase
MSVIKLTDLDIKNKRLLIREDFNVPIRDGKITSDARLCAALFTIDYALNKGAKIILMSHLGRPEEGSYDAQASLEPVAKALAQLLNYPVKFERNWLDGVNFNDEDIILCENVRFLLGEKHNDDQLAKKMAKLADIYVMDAFGSAHRAHASTHGVAKFAKIACAGPLLIAELEALTQALENPIHPVVAIVGGAKVSSKLQVLEAVIKLADQLIIGGALANTFLAAQGINIGKSLYEADLINTAKELLQLAKQHQTTIPLPTDVVVVTDLTPHATVKIKTVDRLTDQDMILDIGPQTAKNFQQIILQAKTIIWNGPVGVFEDERFAAGTKQVALALAQSKAFSIAGGGDTLAAIEKYSISDKISYISTGGGAFLEFLEGKKLPAVAILEQRAILNSETV